MRLSVVCAPETKSSNSYYTTSRPPLRPAPLVKLPLGAVRPAGWLRHQLDLMTHGMTGRLVELSRYVQQHGWFGGEAEGWEEQAYWFRGFHDLAVLTGDERLLAEARHWIDQILAGQHDDGYFGAVFHKSRRGDNGRELCDLWPHMVMLDAFVHHHEHTNDERVLPFMLRFFAFCRDLPDDRFIAPLGEGFGDWKPCIQIARAGDMLPHLYWLYNQTGEGWLLELATRFFRRIAPPTDEWLDHHIVHFTQRFSYPGIYFAQSHNGRHWMLSEYWYNQHLGTWGQQPRGIFAADEMLQTGRTDPRQGFETCGMVEFNKSFYLLGRISGDPVWADRCEDVTLNHFPPAQTPDLKGLHYLTASNQPQLDSETSHEYKNQGRQICYSPWDYRCCQHNVAMGWPWYAQNLWQATADNGLAAWLYAAGEVTARVGDGREVTVRAETHYPFEGAVRMEVEAGAPVSFPLYLRVPRWCEGFRVEVNGQLANIVARPGAYLRLEREWAGGDTVELTMPMKVGLTHWPRTDSVTVDRGPLSYSVRIAERWQRCSGTDEWPEWEVYPDSAWNYALLLDERNPAASLEVVERGVHAAQPWTLEGAPLELRARARRVHGWGIANNTVQEIPRAPLALGEQVEEIALVPLGCARLRMACLPVAEA